MENFVHNTFICFTIHFILDRVARNRGLWDQGYAIFPVTRFASALW